MSNLQFNLFPPSRGLNVCYTDPTWHSPCNRNLVSFWRWIKTSSNCQRQKVKLSNLKCDRRQSWMNSPIECADEWAKAAKSSECKKENSAMVVCYVFISSDNLSCWRSWSLAIVITDGVRNPHFPSIIITDGVRDPHLPSIIITDGVRNPHFPSIVKVLE